MAPVAAFLMRTFEVTIPQSTNREAVELFRLPEYSVNKPHLRGGLNLQNSQLSVRTWITTPKPRPPVPIGAEPGAGRALPGRIRRHRSRASARNLPRRAS